MVRGRVYAQQEVHDPVVEDAYTESIWCMSILVLDHLSLASIITDYAGGRELKHWVRCPAWTSTL